MQAEIQATRLPAATALGHVHLNVADLDGQTAFYTRVLGMKMRRMEGSTAVLGTATQDLLKLSPVAGSKPAEGTTGLYHFCILVPERADLARLLQNIVKEGWPIQGLVDHRTSQAIYLGDPEDNGIELDWDHPRGQWPAGGLNQTMRLGNLPVDPAELLGSLPDPDAFWPGLPATASVGHVHLHVADLEKSRDFYCRVIGFDLSAFIPRQAGFVSVNGYHHHVAFNIWNGQDAPLPPPDATGLRHFTLKLPDQASLEALIKRLEDAGTAVEQGPEGLLARDPSHNAILLRL